MEEDPVLEVGRDAQTHELLVSGNGQVHVEVAVAKMKKKFGVEAILKAPKVPYLETIKKKVGPVQGRHKKQTGGRGQFGDCWIEIEPLTRGAGFEFVDKIFGGSIPQNYRPAVEKGIQEARMRGWLSGNPVVDFRVTLTDGSYHNVDSSEMAFKIAGSLAFKAAMEQARATILEPIYRGDHRSRGDDGRHHGRPLLPPRPPTRHGARRSVTEVRAEVPMAELLEMRRTCAPSPAARASTRWSLPATSGCPDTVAQQVVAQAEEDKKAGEV